MWGHGGVGLGGGGGSEDGGMGVWGYRGQVSVGGLGCRGGGEGGGRVSRECLHFMAEGNVGPRATGQDPWKGGGLLLEKLQG